ncbi:Protein apterous [Gryllus bimaculatus]|nr:Protein apterous [Gryllus bimaculatus]
MTASLDLNADYLDVPFRVAPGTPGGMPGSNGQQRTKRMRTSFKHHQLRTMKSYFAINHNPDAKDLKQLSQKTGLPKRVLQVWFQNARAKWRRMVLKQEGKAGSAAGDKCVGGPEGAGAGGADLDAYPPPPPPPHGPGADYHHALAHGAPLQAHSPPYILGGGSPPSLEIIIFKKTSNMQFVTVPSAFFLSDSKLINEKEILLSTYRLSVEDENINTPCHNVLTRLIIITIA